MENIIQKQKTYIYICIYIYNNTFTYYIGSKDVEHKPASLNCANICFGLFESDAPFTKTTHILVQVLITMPPQASRAAPPGPNGACSPSPPRPGRCGRPQALLRVAPSPQLPAGGTRLR